MAWDENIFIFGGYFWEVGAIPMMLCRVLLAKTECSLADEADMAAMLTLLGVSLSGLISFFISFMSMVPRDV